MDDRVIALWKTYNKVVGSNHLCRVHYFIIGGFGLPVAYVLPDRILEEKGILKDNTRVLAEGLKGELASAYSRSLDGRIHASS